MAPSKVLITGANAGLGKECAKQLAAGAADNGITKIILGCRNQGKAEAAKAELEAATSNSKVTFEILIIDVSNLDSVRNAVKTLSEPVDGLVLNAGGAGGPTPGDMTEYGVTACFAANLLGHVLLVEELLAQKKLPEKSVVMYAGSEAARGIPLVGMPATKLENGSVDEFVTLLDGSFYKKRDMNSLYPAVKLMAAFYMSSMARKYKTIRFVTMSPGGTTGTNAAVDAPTFEKIMFSILMPLFEFMGKFHSLEVGAKRYVDALMMEDIYQSGIFYASENGVTGPVADQVKFRAEFANETYQDNANEAIHKFLK